MCNFAKYYVRLAVLLRVVVSFSLFVYYVSNAHSTSYILKAFAPMSVIF